MKKQLLFLLLSLCSLRQALCIAMLYVSCSVHAQVPSYVPTSGLVGWWPFNGNANDESGNGNNGTVNGATLTTDRFGVSNKAYSFDGVSNKISVPDANSLSFPTKNFSFSFWTFFYQYSNLTNDLCVLGKRQSTNGPYEYFFTRLNSNHATSANMFVPYIWDNDGQCGPYGIPITGVLPLMQDIIWEHYVVTGDGNQSKVYKNGTLYYTITNDALCNIIGTSGNLLIGEGGGWNQTSFMNGKIDDLAIYSRALTQQEVMNLYSSAVLPNLSTTASPTLINCGESATLTASSSSSAQPCAKADLPTTLQNGLVGYWPFCGNANDASGNVNNGTVNGATLTTDRFGNVGSAYHFNGVSNFINVPDANSLDFSNNYTLSGWYQINNINQTDQAIICKGRASSGTGYHLLVNTSPLNLMQFGYNDNVVNGGAAAYATPSILNGWHFITGTYDGSVAKIFIDGILLNSELVVYSLQNSSIPLNIGRETSGIGRYFSGKLDDIAIYNRALTASEIQQLYSIGNVNYTWSTGAITPSIMVSPAQTTSYSCTATNSAGSTTSSVTVNVADSLSWTGLFDTDWHKPCNWSPQFVPKCCNNVVIPLTTNQPIVSGVAAAEDLTIYTTNGAQITVNTGANLQIADCPITITTATCPSLAVLTTTAVSSITQTTAISGGTINYQGASAIAARGICWSTSINPTIANSNTTNGIGIGTFSSNLTGLTAGTTYYVRAYATNASGTSYGNEVSFFISPPQPAYPVGSVFCSGNTTLVIDVTNPSTGKVWMDRNLGASQVATSSIDAAAYGELYQWGRRSDGHQCRTSPTTATISSIDQPAHGNLITVNSGNYDWRSPQNTNLWQGVNGVNNPCPSGYRLPTETEINAERLSWSSSNSAGAFASPLKFPMAGYRVNSTGFLNVVGGAGYYWSSTVSSTTSRYLNFNSSWADMLSGYRAVGYSVRCIKN